MLKNIREEFSKAPVGSCAAILALLTPVLSVLYPALNRANDLFGSYYVGGRVIVVLGFGFAVAFFVSRLKARSGFSYHFSWATGLICYAFLVAPQLSEMLQTLRRSTVHNTENLEMIVVFVSTFFLCGFYYSMTIELRDTKSPLPDHDVAYVISLSAIFFFFMIIVGYYALIVESSPG